MAMSAAALGILALEGGLVATTTSRVVREPRRISNAILILLTLVGAGISVSVIGEGKTPLDAFVKFVLWHSVEFAAVLVVALLANGIVMWRRERRTLTNLLPLVAAGAIVFAGISAVVLVLIGQPWAKVTALLGFLALGWAALLFVAFLLYLWLYARLAGARRADYAVVLGCGLLNGEVSPLLASRVQRAAELVRRERERGNEMLLVLSGGQGADEPRSEASAMADHARALGIPSEWLRLEERSRTTEQNLQFTNSLMEAELGQGARGLVVTSDYHALRAAIIARFLGIDAQAIGAPTARYFLPAAVMREFVALVVRFRAAVAAVSALVVLPLPTLYAVLLMA